MIRKYYADRQEAIEFLYAMLEGHRTQVQLSILNQITDETTTSEIDTLGDMAYDMPSPGLKDITEATAERYIRRFGGHLTGCINEPMSYPILYCPFGDRIGIVME